MADKVNLSMFNATEQRIYKDAVKAYKKLGVYPMRGQGYTTFKDGFKDGEIEATKLPKNVTCGCLTGVLYEYNKKGIEDKYGLKEDDVKALEEGFDGQTTSPNLQTSSYSLGAEVYNAVANPKFVTKIFNEQTPDRLKRNSFLIREIEKLTGVQFGDKLKPVKARTSKKSQKKASQSKSDSGTKSGKTPAKKGGKKGR